MSILKLARMGHPILRTVATAVSDPDDRETRRLVADMVETMLDAGGVGLAAPQVHVGQRIFVFRVPASRVTTMEGDEPVGLTAIINPVIEPLDETTSLGWEGCLSIPGLRGAVPRYNRIRYGGFDLDGERVEREATGFHARVVQHEFDHLNGVMYPERMLDHRLLAFVEEGARFPIDLDAYAVDGKL